MDNPIKIAVDAMGGENSHDKVIKGIEIIADINKYILSFGNKDFIDPIIKKTKIGKNKYQIIHTENSITDTDSPLTAAKGKDTSMWLSIESLKKSQSDAIVSAGNTGALFVIAKLNLKMIEKIDKPALSAFGQIKVE